MVEVGAGEVAMLETTEKRGAGITNEEVLLETMLDMIEKSGGGMDIEMVVDVVGETNFELRVADVRLDFEVFGVVLELAGVLDVGLEVVDAVLNTAEVVIGEVRGAEVVLELAGALMLKTGVIDGVFEFIGALTSDLGEADVIVEFLEMLEAGASLGDAAFCFLRLLVTDSELVDVVPEALKMLEARNLPVEAAIRFLVVLEMDNFGILVASEVFEVLGVGNFLVDVKEEREKFLEAEVAELVSSRLKSGNLKQDTSPKLSSQAGEEEGEQKALGRRSRAVREISMANFIGEKIFI